MDATGLPRASDVFIARHAERQDQVQDHWARTAERPDDPPLAEKGLSQARELAERLAAVPLRRIISSPYVRCVHTAAIVAEKHPGLKVLVEPGFGEIAFRHPPTVLPLPQLAAEFDVVDSSYEPCTSAPTRSEGESDAVKRASGAVVRVMERFRLEGAVLLVGHGATCTGMLSGLAHRTQYVGLATLTRLVPSSSKGWKVDFVGDSSHMSPENRTDLRAY